MTTLLLLGKSAGNMPLGHVSDFVREHGVRAAASRDLCATCHSEGQCAACHGVTTPALPWKLTFDRNGLTGLHRAGFLARRQASEALGDFVRLVQVITKRRRPLGNEVVERAV